MIVEALCSLVKNLLSLLLVFELPPFPETITTIFNSVIEYLVMGRNLLQTLIGAPAMGVIGVCLVLVVAANSIYFTWSVVIFILKKIPFLGIE